MRYRFITWLYVLTVQDIYFAVNLNKHADNIHKLHRL